MDKFSERLVALRKEKDLTQAEFARLCGKQRTTVSGYETELFRGVPSGQRKLQAQI